MGNGTKMKKNGKNMSHYVVAYCLFFFQGVNELTITQ